MRWQDQIKILLQRGTFRTQKDLAESLTEYGFHLNQATISRELRRIRVRKVDGFYRLPTHATGGAPVLSVSVTGGGCLAVLRTHGAHASVLAQQIDLAQIDGVLGTIAGEDTVFVALADPEVMLSLRACLGVAPVAQ